MRNLLAVALLALAPAFAPNALTHAQTIVAQRDSVYSFDLVAQPLGPALAAVARRAGLVVVARHDDLLGLSSEALVGSMTAVAAIDRLLAGTGLVARLTDSRTVRIARAGSENAPTTLRRVEVIDRVAQRGYGVRATSSATKTDTPLREVPQAVAVVTGQLIADQSMQSMADVVRYLPGVSMAQGEGHRDAAVIRGQSSTADFFVDGVRDDAQYLRDLYNTDRVEALKAANAMVFGRGGGGGVLNRVTKRAEWTPTHTLTLEGGSWDHKRTTLDVGDALGTLGAARLNAVAEKSGGFRDAARLERWGINPTAALEVGSATTVRASYERFRDDRRVDRGVPSFAGFPSPADITTFFGNPAVNTARSDVNAGELSMTRELSTSSSLRARVRSADYELYYRNTFPGVVSADGGTVALSAYDHTLARRNLSGQLELTGDARTGAVTHTLLAGVEGGRQRSSQFRNTGYFAGGAATLSVPFAAPTVSAPVTFSQSATDADNGTATKTASIYVQDQAAVGPLKLVGGLRAEHFALGYHDNRSGADLSRDDALLSPRLGAVIDVARSLSLYGSWGISYLPSSGDQFSTLTVTTQNLEPERFRNAEVGAKWDALTSLSLTAALYQLERSNTASPDPVDPTHTVQTGRQRSSGVELQAIGAPVDRWQVAAGVAMQRARIVDRTSAAPAGASVPLVPSRTLSLWNRLQLFPALGAGVGVIHNGSSFAAIDNTVTLPAWTRLDGALYGATGRGATVQLNVENLLNTHYWPTSQGNNNIMPGAPRSVRVSVATGF